MNLFKFKITNVAESEALIATHRSYINYIIGKSVNYPNIGFVRIQREMFTLIDCGEWFMDNLVTMFGKDIVPSQKSLTICGVNPLSLLPCRNNTDICLDECLGYNLCKEYNNLIDFSKSVCQNCYNDGRYEYQDDITSTSYKFCQCMIGRFYSKEELEQDI